MDPNHANEVVPYLTSGAIIMYVQRWMKSFEWYQAFVKVVPGADKWAHRGIAAIGALIAALGIGWTFDWTAAEGGQAIIRIPGLSALLHGCWDFLVVYIFQQGWYDATIAKPMIALAPTRAHPAAEAVVIGDRPEP